IVSGEQIASDLTQLAKITGCIRTYSFENGLNKVPELASNVTLKVLLGVWIGRDRLKNTHLMKTALSLVGAYPSVVTALIVGCESRGMMREGALPARVNQARFISEILDRARKEHFQVNLFEAYDEPWKRQWEGTVGGSWGLFDGWSREVKYPPGTAVSNFPFWKLQLGSGLALSISVFGAALAALWRRPSMPGLVSWVA